MPAGDFKINGGGAMARFVLRRLGLRRSVEIGRLLNPGQSEPSRRGLLRGAVASIAIGVGWAIGAPTVASANTRVLTAEEATRRFESLNADPGITQALTEIDARGYDIEEADCSGASIEDGSILVFASFASRADPHNDTAVLLTKQTGVSPPELHWGSLPRPQELGGAQ